MAVTDSPLRNYYTGLRPKLPASVNRLLPHQRLAAPDARNNAYSGLCYMGSAAREQVPQLAKLLKHRDKQVRVYAIMLLGGFGTDAKAATPALLEASRDPDPEVSGHAVEALRPVEGRGGAGPGK